MIERIEVTTGGASAVYGSDAVAGVVNIVTKKTIDGFEFDAATTRPQQDGGEENFYSFTFGGVQGDTDFITNVTYADQSQVRGDARDFVRNAVIPIDNPANKNGTDGIPGRIIWDQTGNPILRTSHNTGASQFGCKDCRLRQSGVTSIRLTKTAVLIIHSLLAARHKTAVI